MTSEFIDLLESELGRFRAEANHLIGRELTSDVLLETWLQRILHDPVAYQFASRNKANLSASFLAIIITSSEALGVADLHLRLDDTLGRLARAFDTDEPTIRRQISPARETLYGPLA